VTAQAVDYQVVGDDRVELETVNIDSISAVGNLNLTLTEGAIIGVDSGQSSDWPDTPTTGSYAVGVELNTNNGDIFVEDAAILVAGSFPRIQVSVEPGGEIAPASGQGGDIHSGDVNFSTAGTFTSQLTRDPISQLNVEGTLDLGQQTALNVLIDDTFVPRDGEFVLIENDGVDPVRGTFASLAEGALVEFSPIDGATQPTRLFQLSYSGGDGNDISLSYRADAGGPYVIDEGDSLSLTSHVASDLTGPNVTFLWDIDNDGVFDEVIAGNSPQLSWAELTALGVADGPRQSQVAVQIQNGNETITTNANFTINNVAPTANIVAPASQLTDHSVALTVSALNEPLQANSLAGFEFAIDFGDGQSSLLTGQGETIVLDHIYSTSGTYTISLTVTDKDGGSTTTSHDINVAQVILVDGDLVVGATQGNDRVIVSDAGADTVFVRVNNQRLGPFSEPVGGQIILVGGTGSDRITASGNVSLNLVYEGGTGRDYLAGGTGDNTFFGGDGNDQILTGAGNNWVDAGAGNDLVSGRNGDDYILGGEGNDRLQPGSGNDFVNGEAGNDRITGSGGNDIPLGGSGNDRLDGGRGNDILFGGSSNDHLLGQDGDDLLLGNAGKDQIGGGRGADLLHGGNASSTLDDPALQQLLSDWSTSRNRQALGTIDDDNEGDGLNGGGGVDDIFAGALDNVISRANDNVVTF
jgi:Ca2+-binding RTX toxin-like protein